MMLTVETNSRDRFPETAMARSLLDPEARNRLTNETRRGVSTWRSGENSSTDCGIISKTPTLMNETRDGELAQHQLKKEKFTPTGLLDTTTTLYSSCTHIIIPIPCWLYYSRCCRPHNVFLGTTNLGDGKNPSGLPGEVPCLLSRHALKRYRALV